MFNNKIEWKISLFSQDVSLLEQMIDKIKDICISKVIKFVTIPLPTEKKVIGVKKSAFKETSMTHYELLKLKRVIFLTVSNNEESNPINILRDVKIIPGIEIRLSKVK